MIELSCQIPETLDEAELLLQKAKKANVEEIKSMDLKFLKHSLIVFLPICDAIINSIEFLIVPSSNEEKIRIESIKKEYTLQFIKAKNLIEEEIKRRG